MLQGCFVTKLVYCGSRPHITHISCSHLQSLPSHYLLGCSMFSVDIYIYILRYICYLTTSIVSFVHFGKHLIIFTVGFFCFVILLCMMDDMMIMICRQEKLIMGFSGIVKIAGTVVGIGGAMLFTFYRGPIFTIWPTHIDLLRQYNNSSSFSSSSSHMNNPALGFLAGFGSILCFSLWLIVQVIFHSSTCHK